MNADGTDSTSSPDVIDFDIVASGVQTITMGSSAGLTVNDPVVIDGYSQPGSSQNTSATADNANLTIALTANGPATSATQYGLILDGSNSVVDGLDFQGFSYGIFAGAGNDIIYGNFIGTDPTGTISEETGNATFIGVYLDGQVNGSSMVGGTTPSGAI